MSLTLQYRLIRSIETFETHADAKQNYIDRLRLDLKIKPLCKLDRLQITHKVRCAERELTHYFKQIEDCKAHFKNEMNAFNEQQPARPKPAQEIPVLGGSSSFGGSSIQDEIEYLFAN